MTATSKWTAAFPAETESRLQDFTDLAGDRDLQRQRPRQGRASWRRSRRRCAASPPSSRGRPRRRRCSRPIAEEIGRLLAVDSIEMVRYADDRAAVIVAGWGPLAAALPIGTRVPLGGRNVDLARLPHRPRRAPRRLRRARAGRSPRSARGRSVRSAVGTPIIVEGRLWGAMLAAGDARRPLPPDTESRIGQFTELMATAIANAEARAEVARLADEQAALRRVATLVAEGAPPAAVFDAVTGEVAELLDASAVIAGPIRGRRDHGGRHSTGTPTSRSATAFRSVAANVTSTVLRTGRTARLDDVTQATGAIGDVACAGPASGRRSRPRRRRRPHVGRARRDLDGPRAAARRHRGAAGQVRRSCSTPRSPTRTAATSSPRRARGCSPRATRPAGAWCETCTTAPSSGSCTRSSRSSSHGRRSTVTRAARTRCSPMRSTPPSGRPPRCASWRTGSCRRCSPTAGCAPASTRFASRLGPPRRARRVEGAAACGHRGQRVLHRRRGADQRGQARPGDAGCRQGSASKTASSSSRCATTEWAGPIPKDTAWSASPTGSTRSAADCRSPVRKATGPRWPSGCPCRRGGRSGRTVAEGHTATASSVR